MFTLKTLRAISVFLAGHMPAMVAGAYQDECGDEEEVVIELVEDTAQRPPSSRRHMEKKIRLEITIDPKLKRRLQMMAIDEGSSVSLLTEKIVAMFFEGRKK